VENGETEIKLEKGKHEVRSDTIQRFANTPGVHLLDIILLQRCAR
jgi:hypothetical protein